MKKNGESTVGKLRIGDFFINTSSRDGAVYYSRGEYNRGTGLYMCRCYYRSTNIRWSHEDRYWSGNKITIKYTPK